LGSQSWFVDSIDINGDFKMTGSVSISDILLLLDQDWVPEKKKDQIRNMILDTIDLADEMTKKMASSFEGSGK